MASTKKNAVFPAVAGALLIVIALVSAVTISNQNASLDAQKAQLSSITHKVDAARSATSKLETMSSLEPEGARASRVSSDTLVIDDLAKRTLSWNSNASYSKARASTMRMYGLSEDSSFMKTFLPPAPVNRDSQGNEYPYIDAAGLNSQVGDVTVKLLSVDTLDYSYMALVDVQSSSSDGLGTAVNVATLFVTIDGDGKVSKLSGYASTTPPVTSN